MKQLLILCSLVPACQTEWAEVDEAVRSRFGRPCTEHDACVVVVMPCDRCGCADRAILADRNGDLAAMARRVDCGTAPPAPDPCPPCAAQTARCVAGVCQVVEGKPENPQLELEVQVGGSPVHVVTALAEWTETSLLLHFDLGPRACHLADDAPLSLLFETAGDRWRVAECRVNGERWAVQADFLAPQVRVDTEGMLVTELDFEATGERQLRVRGTVVAHDCAPRAHPHTPRERRAVLGVGDRSAPVRGAILYTGGEERVLLVSAGPLSCERADPASLLAGFRLPTDSPLAEQVCVGGTDLPVACHDAPRGVQVQTSTVAGGEVIAILETRRARVGYRLAVDGRLHPEVCAATFDLAQRLHQLSVQPVDNQAKKE